MEYGHNDVFVCQFTISRSKNITLICKGIQKADFQYKMHMFKYFLNICSLGLNFNRCK